MKLMLRTILTLVSLTFLIACTGPDSTGQQGTSKPETKPEPKPQVVIPTKQAAFSGPLIPPANWPASGSGWKFNPNRPDPVECRFTVKVDGYKPASANLIAVYGEQTYTVEKVDAKADGTVVFTKQGGYLGGFYYIYFPDKSSIAFVMDKDQIFNMTAPKSNMANVKVDDCKDIELYYSTIAYEKTLNPKFTVVNAKLKGKEPKDPGYKEAKAEQSRLLQQKLDYLHKLKKDNPNTFYPVFKLSGQNPIIKEVPMDANGEVDNAKFAYLYRKNFWNDVDFGDLRLLRTPVLHTKLKRYMSELTPQSIDSMIRSSDVLCRKAFAGGSEIYRHVVNYVGNLYKKEECKIMGCESIFIHMIDTYFTDRLAFWDKHENLEKLRDHIEEKRLSQIGKIGQNVTATDVNGQKKSLYDLQSKYTVIFMYTPECEHCQEAVPELVKIYDKFHSKGLGIFGICTGTQVERWKKFVKSEGMQWTNVVDTTFRSYYMKWHVDITPEIYLLDENHKIIAKDLKPFQLEEMLESRLP